MLTIEMWKTVVVKGVKTKYEISSSGRIRTKKKGKVKILKPSFNQDGYKMIQIKVGDKKVTKKIHRLVAEAFVENPDPERFKEVNHLNGDKANNDMDNLEWTDRSGNMHHAFDTGLILPMKGEDHPGHKHTEKQIREVCELMEEGHTNKEIHEKTGIKSDILSDIRSGDSWTHITDDYKFKPVPHPNKQYTDEQIHQVCSMMQSGFNNTEISEALDISYNVVADIRRGKTWTHISQYYNISLDGHPNRKYTEDDVHKICQMLEDGKSSREVSNELDISYNVVSDIRRKKTWTSISKNYNINPAHEKVDNSKHWDKVDELLLQGYTRKEIREKYPIPDLTKQQYITLIQNRVDHLKKEGKLT